MLELSRNPLIKGFTTNPTLMLKEGITDYQAFALDILQAIPDRPISFEVFSDDFAEMERLGAQDRRVGRKRLCEDSCDKHLGASSMKLVQDLAQAGVKLNVTALTALDQVRDASAALAEGPPAFVSVFAGRVAIPAVIAAPYGSRGGAGSSLPGH